jgi:ubiquinone/menaquinone biosynthesis C-methylase UbiE
MAPVLADERPADYLLRVARSAIGTAYKDLAADLLGAQAGETVLDLGCGPGADLARFATVVTGTGSVIGLDTDAEALRQVRRGTVGLSQVHVVHADLHALPLPAACIDRVHTDRVLQHVANPEAALLEVSRVLRPGGVALLAEPDWETFTVDYPDGAVPRAYTRFIVERVVRNSLIGKQLPRLARAAGLVVDEVLPVTTVFTDTSAADEIFGFRRVTARAVTAGYLHPDAAAAWLNHLDTQPLFVSATVYLTRLSAPA